MPRQLNIRSDTAYDLAHDLARRLDKSATEVIEAALRDFRDRVLPPREPTIRAEFVEEILALGAKARAELRPGTTSDHADLYDERGAPR
jgi:antitoxin VapB